MSRPIEDYRQRDFTYYQLVLLGVKAMKDNDKEVLEMCQEMADIREQQLVHQKLRDDIGGQI